MTRETIARYELQSEIGRGGMATVYLAYDPNFRRNVAVKLVSGNLQSEQMYRQRFEREAHLIARIEHPAIVPVYDYGEHENNLYLVMRYMPGGSLAQKIKDGEFSLRDAVQMLSQIAPALDAAHAQGIVHRDLKPGNILFDGFGNPAISDFGIAHFTAATSDLTGSAIIGTPAYMSPEQVRGEKELDGRSDIYALGVILFEVLAGRSPFQAKTPMSIALQHLNEPVPSIRALHAGLPPALDRILGKAMAKDRELRYATAAELVRELRSVPDAHASAPTPRPGYPAALHDAATEVDSAGDLAAGLPASGLPAQPSPAGGQPAGGASSKRFAIIALAALGILVFLVCGSLGLFGTWAGLRGLVSGAGPTVIPSPPATATSVVPEVVLFDDDFADPNSGWPAGQNEIGTYGYGPDGYYIRVSRLNQWVSIDRVPEDASLEVDATPLIESGAGYYGVICRIRDAQNFYLFVVDHNGEHTIAKFKDGDFLSLTGAWRSSDAIRAGTQTNRLRADCAGTRLRFYVNDVLVDEATDTEFTSGPGGLIAAALNGQVYEVRFNQFAVKTPAP